MAHTEDDLEQMLLRFWRSLPPEGKDASLVMMSRWADSSIAPNARLIAAAPELLAACKAALLFHSAPIWGPEEAAEWHALVDPLLGTRAESANTKILCDAIRAAIAKATAP